MTTYSFDQLRDAVQECTSYDLVQRFSDDEDEFLLIDPYGDVDGEPFYDLIDVEDFIRNNDQVDLTSTNSPTNDLYHFTYG
jgi:hypothetical protein